MHSTNNQHSKTPPGYFRVPGNDLIAVTRSGDCLNLLTGNPTKVVLNKESGYLTVHVTVNGRSRNFLHHRLVALAFIEKPERHSDKSFDVLQVNHIDGVKTNNAVENLEWVTPKENMEHVFRLGLKGRGTVGIKHQRRDRLTFSVYARDIRTNELQYYLSSDICAAEFGISPIRLRRHLTSSLAGRVTKNWCVFSYADQLPFPALRPEQIEESSWDMVFGAWFATDTESGAVHLGSTLKELSAAIGLESSAVQTAHHRNPEAAYQGRWLFRYDDSALPDALKKVSHYKQRVIFAPKVVTATNRVTGDVLRYASRNIAAQALALHPDRIRYAMKAKAGVVGDWTFHEAESQIPESVRTNRIIYKELLNEQRPERRAA